MCLTFLGTRYSSLFCSRAIIIQGFNKQPTTDHSQTLNKYLARYFGVRYLNISIFLSCNEKSQVIQTPLRILLSERKWFARDVSLTMCLSRRQALLIQERGKKEKKTWWFSSLLCFRKGETQFFLLLLLLFCSYCFSIKAVSVRVRGEVTLD